jgi:hypothetical protein
MSEKEFKTKLAKVNDTFFPMIEGQLENNNIDFSQYAKSCTLNAIAAINNVLDTNGITWNDANLDTSDITQTLLTVATLQLNPTASPREVYFQIRNIGIKSADGKSTTWKKRVEMGIEGDGWDSLLSRFGRDVKKVAPYWLVKENDEFSYPKYDGLSMTPPKWTPKGDGKVVRVVYPVLHKDDTIHFYIAERADVKKNLIAHITNNLMNETFGICTDRYKATAEQKEQIANKKREVLNSAKALDLDSLLDSPDFDKYISPAWKEEQSRESMIIRKMRNNIVKKIPKDFSSSLQAELYNESSDETYKVHKAEMLEASNEPLEDAEIIDVEPTTDNVDKETGEITDKPEF